MLHRMLASALLGLGFMGAGSLALACQTTGETGDCCPQDSSTLCGQRMDDRPATLACCAAAPAPAKSGSISASRSDNDRKHDSGSPDLLPLPLPTAQAADDPPSDFPAHFAGTRCSDGILTYLRTGRLRL